MADATTNTSINTTETKSKKKRKNKKKAAKATTTENLEEKEEAKDNGQIDGKDDKESDDSDPEPELDESDAGARRTGTSTETSVDDEAIPATTNNVHTSGVSEEPANHLDDPTARFDALVKDRDALRAEVSQLRQSLEELTSSRDEETETLKTELQEIQGEKEHAEEQFQNLLGKVNTIRSQLGERLKANAEELGQARTIIEELEEQKSELQEQYTSRSAEVEDLSSKVKEQEKTIREQEAGANDLRSRLTLSQQNWVQEREELVEAEAYVREEFENAKQAMHDWEVLAMEERQIRRDLSDRVADLEEQLATTKADFERAARDRDAQSSTVDGLQRALQEIQEARRKELREHVETSQSELQGLKKQLEDLQTESEKHKSTLVQTKKELERALPFEKEVKEKNLLIGKLRHEAVILNDHLTKALRFLKKGKPEDNIDRQIVTNHFLQFLALDRSDPKKFQILQLIASLLNWTDEQKEQAGLARPGASNLSGSLRLPTSPLFHRTPSTPALNADYFTDSANLVGSPQRESLAELWQNFLEQEASSNVRGGHSRKASTTSTVAAGSVTSPISKP